MGVSPYRSSPQSVRDVKITLADARKTACLAAPPLLFLVVGLAGCGSPPEDGAESVVVVHGLGRTRASMAILASRLKNAGFRVVSFAYPSTSEPIEALVNSPSPTGDES